MPRIRFLLDRLEDRFEMFPFQSVSSELGGMVSNADQRRYDRNAPYGVADQFRSAEDDHDVAMTQLFIASAFVLGQAAVAQAVSIVTRVRELAGQPYRLPHRKADIMTAEAPLHSTSGLSKIVIVDAV